VLSLNHSSGNSPGGGLYHGAAGAGGGAEAVPHDHEGGARPRGAPWGVPCTSWR